MIKKRFHITLSLLILLGISVSLLAFKKQDSYFEILRNIELFSTVYKEINRNYVDPLNPVLLMNTGIKAMLRELDPYTTYTPEEDIEDYRTQTTSERGRLGIFAVKYQNRIIITEVIQGCPAYEAGLQVGDEVIAIDGKKNIGTYKDIELENLIQGEIGTEINLLIKRYAQELKIYTIVRQHINIDKVPYRGQVTHAIGLIQLTDYGQNATREIKSAVLDLKEKGVTRFILDLRNNPGGLLSEAIGICNLFIDKNLEVVETKGRSEGSNKRYKTLDQPIDKDSKLVVLINHQSASASEITAGVIQDYDRGIIMGSRSFGKGLVQVTRPLPYNAQLKITVSKYYIPSGRCIQELDYSHLNPNHTPTKYAVDSAIVFKTKSGRSVFSGQGINPDIYVELPKYAPITISLFENQLFTQYSAVYRAKYLTIDSPRSFSISDADYKDFINWLNDKTFDYRTQAEKAIDNFIENARDEQYYHDLKNEIEGLHTQVMHDKSRDLIKYKPEIKEALEENYCKKLLLFRWRFGIFF